MMKQDCICDAKYPANRKKSRMLALLIGMTFFASLVSASGQVKGAKKLLPLLTGNFLTCKFEKYQAISCEIKK